ncbi:hypothetical protein GBA52_010110 [Prunus armeniaca]|nr:hypothetical protein GBA52_010110 [Prunus armeniaca]
MDPTFTLLNNTTFTLINNTTFTLISLFIFIRPKSIFNWGMNLKCGQGFSQELSCHEVQGKINSGKTLVSSIRSAATTIQKRIQSH